MSTEPSATHHSSLFTHHSPLAGARVVLGVTGSIAAYKAVALASALTQAEAIVDVISARGEFLGGVFAPGLETGLEGLISRAARLRSIELRAPSVTIGKNTADCMRAGVVYGYVGLVEGLLARIAAELGERPLVVATGGLAPLIVAETTAIDVLDPDLTLHGLRLLYDLNRPTDGRAAAAAVMTNG